MRRPARLERSAYLAAASPPPITTRSRRDMRNRQASVVFVLITLFIDILGMGLVIPILPRLVQSMLGGAIGEASFVYGLLLSLYAVMQFVCAPLLGALSDG